MHILAAYICVDKAKIMLVHCINGQSTRISIKLPALALPSVALSPNVGRSNTAMNSHSYNSWSYDHNG